MDSKNMYSPEKVRAKICCINSLAEAKMAIECGASALGLVSEMPSGPGVISEDMIAKIAAIIPPGVASFLLTCKQDTIEIIAQQKRCGVNTIQLCDSIVSGSYQDFRREIPGISIVQVIHVSGSESIQEAMEVSEWVDAILLDSGNPTLSVKQLGGTGRVHDWEISRKIRDAVDVPLFLAGGLTPENVSEAITRVRPFGVDVCSGVRTQGLLDKKKLKNYMAAVCKC
jgi:phosphoribosylanthranilate isomerase